MKIQHLIPILFLAAFCTVSAQTNGTPSPGQSSIASSFDIDSIRATQFKADDYILAATTLQAMGRDSACAALLASDKRQSRTDDRLFVLCRMLFTQRDTNDFQQPYRMRVCLVGEAVDWRLYPIEIVDGVPFFLEGSGGGGDGGRMPDTGEQYLQYCITNCDWNTYKFHEVTAKQKKDALAKLLATDKAKQPLNDFQKDFFSRQIE